MRYYLNSKFMAEEPFILIKTIDSWEQGISLKKKQSFRRKRQVVIKKIASSPMENSEKIKKQFLQEE